MRPVSRNTLPALLLALACPLAVATPKDDLHESFAKFLKLRSFRASIIDLGTKEPTSRMEFVAPDRYRMVANGAPQSVVIGNTMYMDMGGQFMPVPVPGLDKMIGQYRNPQFLRDLESGMEVKMLGEESIDGEPARVYAYTVTQPVRSQSKSWISQRSGLPIQTDSTATVMGRTVNTRVRYSGFDDASIRIDAPN